MVQISLPAQETALLIKEVLQHLQEVEMFIKGAQTLLPEIVQWTKEAVLQVEIFQLHREVQTLTEVQPSLHLAEALQVQVALLEVAAEVLAEAAVAADVQVVEEDN